MDKREALIYLGFPADEEVTPGSRLERCIEALAQPVDAGDLDLIDGWDQLTEHDRHEIATFATFLRVAGPAIAPAVGVEPGGRG
jgi:hypothetical protein